ncbi:MAG: ATP-dependent DNA helicase RecG [Parcubacteria bacterium C7867-003]|nr:MAG: ATP-dependent DNA helicase RecG [Parcubacteria bacterium C7867-003]
MKLNNLLEAEFRLTFQHKGALKKMGILTIEDLLYHFPVRYGDTGEINYIENVSKGDTTVIFGTISGLKTSKAFIKKIPMSEAVVTDETGRIKLVWFNQPYIAKMMKEGGLVRVEGKVSERKNEIYMSNPKIEMIKDLPNAVGDSLFGKAQGEEHTMYPVYPESRGVTSYWIYHTIQKIFASGILDTLVDPIPENILKKYNLPNIRTAFIWIHAPKKEDDGLSARKRFAFQEIFFIQLEKQKEKKLWSKLSSFKIDTSSKDVTDFIKRFPFEATVSQKEAINSITQDFKRGHPMSRLLEGDVGSGKTAVAATTIYAVTKSQPLDKTGKKITGNLQTAYMVPTEILAKQHYENFISYFNHLPIKIGLVTGSECKIFPSKTDPTKPTKISKTQLLKWVANGEVPIVIGTHALISKSVTFKHLAFVIIDEQHRFGTLQRQKLTTKSPEGKEALPHLLSMTATNCIWRFRYNSFGRNATWKKTNYNESRIA